MLPLCLLLAFSGIPRGEKGDEWSVEPFSGPLSGKTVTVTRPMWADGALTQEGQEGPLRPETVFALRCLQAERPDLELTAECGSGYMASLAIPGQETGAWLRENVWRFGLIAIRESEEMGKHLCLRYVGTAHAAAMHALGMDLEEYLLFLRKTGRAALLRNGRTAAWIFCLPEEAAITFALPEGAAWEISGDNAGCVIVAVRSGS